MSILNLNHVHHIPENQVHKVMLLTYLNKHDIYVKYAHTSDSFAAG